MLVRCLTNSRNLSRNTKYCWNIWRYYSQETGSENLPNHSESEQSKKLGYAKAFEKFENIGKESGKPQTFPELLMNSKFIDLGDPEGKVVIGKIFHVVDDDLYIDFGWKFHCVCPRPKTNASSYVRGAKVRLMIKDLELSSKFLGYEKDLTLLESDCVLLGILQEYSAAKNV